MNDASLGSLFEQIVRDIKGSWRFRWHALIVASTVCSLGWLGVLAMPDVYEARARVFVDTSSRLRDVLGTIAFQPDIQSRVNIVRQAMLGGPQLERVAERTGLVNDSMPTEERERVIAGLADTVSVSAGRSSINRNMFGITYTHSDRALSAAVVDEILTSFVEDVIQQKTRGADAAQDFLRNQIAHYEDQLAAADTRLAEFKRQNVGLLPGEGQDYFGRMQTEVSRLDALRSDLIVAKSRRDELQRQLTGETPYLPEGEQAGVVGAANVPGGDIAQRIAQLERNLDELLLRYTEAHPDVIGIKEQIAQLRQRRADELRALMQTDGGAPNATNPVYQNIRISLNEANVQVAAVEAQIANASQRVAELRSLLNTMPEVEAELSRLTRDYTSTKALYDQLVNQLERERLVNEGDDRQVVEFRIIDPPAASLDPVAPRRTILLLGVLILGLGAGGTIAFLLHLLRPVFADSRQLRTVTGLPVVGAVSLVLSGKDALRRRMSATVFFVLATMIVATGGALVVFKEPAVALVQQWVA